MDRDFWISVRGDSKQGYMACLWKKEHSSSGKVETTAVVFHEAATPDSAVAFLLATLGDQLPPLRRVEDEEDVPALKLNHVPLGELRGCFT